MVEPYKRPVTPEEMATCRKMLDALTAERELLPFMEPVPWKDLKLLDYPRVVKKPMDLGTVKKKLIAKSYPSSKEFAADVKQIWENCMLYNADGSEFFKLAQKWDKHFEKEAVKHLKVFTKKVPPPRPLPPKVKGPSIDEKTQFCRAMYEVDENQLGTIVKTIDNLCEGALDKSKQDMVEINVDIIDLESFKKVDGIMRDFQTQNKKKRPVTGYTSISKRSKA